MLMAPWFDRPLSVAGRVIIRRNGGLKEKLINIKRDLVMIPNLAIHMNREAHNGVSYNCLLYTSQGFTELHTPKIGARGAEGGANLFKFSYFHKPAVLAQSPQFYKQMMVGVFDRVFETGPVFRAEKHNRCV